MKLRLSISPVDDALCWEVRTFIAEQTPLQDASIIHHSSDGWGECEIRGKANLTEIGELYRLLQEAYPNLYVQVEPDEEHLGWAWLPENQQSQT